MPLFWLRRRLLHGMWRRIRLRIFTTGWGVTSVCASCAWRRLRATWLSGNGGLGWLVNDGAPKVARRTVALAEQLQSVCLVQVPLDEKSNIRSELLHCLLPRRSDVTKRTGFAMPPFQSFRWQILSQ